MDNAYTLVFATPTIEDYCRLRVVAGLSPRSAAAAAAGLPNTVVGLVVKYADVAVGMGRVIGDGLFYQVVDIAVEPGHQRHGLGKAIIEGLMDALKRKAPAEAYVSLMADGQAHGLYQEFGFKPTAPTSIGMAQWIGK